MFGRTVTSNCQIQQLQAIHAQSHHAGTSRTHEFLLAVSFELVRSTYRPKKSIRPLGVTLSSFAADNVILPSEFGLGFGLQVNSKAEFRSAG